MVRSHRAMINLRIDDAASLCGVSSDVFSRLENGRPVGTDKVLRVLDGLGLGLLILEKDTALQLERSIVNARQNEPEAS
ncbi:helix-turn-helix domain-containing protein [Caballeronia humi]